MGILRVGFLIPPRLTVGRFIEAEDCCWGAMGKRVLSAMLPAAVSQMTDAFFVDLSIDRPGTVFHLRPDVIVYPVIWAYHWEIVTRMSRIFPKLPHVIISVPFGYADFLALQHPHIFAVINSEPEAVFADFDAENFGQLRMWRETAPGVTWYSELAGLHSNGYRRNCMDNLAQTNFDLIPHHYWRYYQKAVMYQVTRGCPYRCRFCVWGGSTCTDLRFRMRPAHQVAEALYQIRDTANKALHLGHKNPQPVTVRLLSAQLTTRLDWLKIFHELMSPFPYPFQGNVNLLELTEEKIGLLMEAGMYSASAGFEALNDRGMALMKKPHSFEEALAGALILENSGINYKLNFRYGYGENPEDVKEAIDNLWRMYRAGIRRARVKLAGLVYYRGTSIEKRPPCAIEQDPRFSVPVKKMRGSPLKEWAKAQTLITDVLDWKRP